MTLQMRIMNHLAKVILAALIGISRLAAQSPDASFDSAKRAYDQSDYASAVKQLQPLAENNNVEAQLLLGKMILAGQGTSKDPAQALKWFVAAAKQGNPDAQFFAGSMYFMGAGVTHDSAQGLDWLRKSAEHGSSDAQVFLGLLYRQGGGGVASDLVEADMWLHLAADGGDPLAPAQILALEKQMTPQQIDEAKTRISSRASRQR